MKYFSFQLCFALLICACSIGARVDADPLDERPDLTNFWRHPRFFDSRPFNDHVGSARRRARIREEAEDRIDSSKDRTDDLTGDQSQGDRNRSDSGLMAEDSPLGSTPAPGSEFNTPSFIDLDLSADVCKGLLQYDKPVQPTKPDFRRPFSSEKDVQDDESQLSADDDLRTDLLEDIDAKRWKQLTDVDVQLHDWVPDKVHRQQNGGFELAPDNGSPVPYRLNGHVGIERGLPWKANDD